MSATGKRPQIAGSGIVLSCVAGGLVLGLAAAHAEAGPINTSVTLAPRKGGTLWRTQWRHLRLGDDPTPLEREVELTVFPQTVAHSVSPDLTVIGTAPIVNREIRTGGNGNDPHATGVADIPVVAKHRLFRRDELHVTTQASALAGGELPTFDRPFSSESLDPIIGAVFTHLEARPELRWGVSADLAYQLNTAGGRAGDDEVRADTAYWRELLRGRSEPIGRWTLFGVAELNATYLTDGSAELLGSPGVQLVTRRWVLEAGVQLPIYQDVAETRLERGITTVLSFKMQF